MDIATLAYTGAIIDTQAILRIRRTALSDLPEVAVNCPDSELLTWLGELTGTSPIITRRSNAQAGCAQHCATKHVHVQSVSARWSLTGARATILCYNILPYLRRRGEEARHLLVVGREAGYKTATVENMRTLGWEIPHIREGRLSV